MSHKEQGKRLILSTVVVIAMIIALSAWLGNRFTVLNFQLEEARAAAVIAEEAAARAIEAADAAINQAETARVEAEFATGAADSARKVATSATALAETANAKPTLDNKVSQVLLNNKNSVVAIHIDLNPEQKKLVPAGMTPPSGIGTGWFVKVTDEAGYVVTNHHVIENYLKFPNFMEISVSEVTSPWLYDVTIVGHDVISDLAVLRVAKVTGNETWEPLKWADHKALREGDPVVAIGHGMSLPWSMSTGIITALDRWQIRQYNLMIQTDTVVNPGNSGGPLMNLDGEVVGVVNALLDPGGKGNRDNAAYAGVSLIIAGFQAEKAVNEIIKYGNASYPNFDFNIRNPSREEYDEITKYGYSSYVVVSIADEEQDIQVDDVIISINGATAIGMVSVIKEILHYSPGDIVDLGILRDGKFVTKKYTLTDLKDRNKAK